MSQADDDSGMVSMKRSKADIKKDSVMTSPMDSERYPYGLRLSLQKDELAKLGIKRLPGVGDTFEIEAMVKVVSVSAGASEGSQDRMSVDLQITDMCCELDEEAQTKVAGTIVS